MMKKAFWILAALLFVSVAVNVVLMVRQPTVETKIERDTVWKDTMIYEPQPAETIDIGKTVYIKVAVPQPQTQHDTVHDSIEVPVTIVQKRYDDSLYTAWVSGFRPNLDSIRLYQPTITETITKTIVKPSPIITFGVQAGAGWSVFHRQPDVYVGVGGQVNLWQR